MKNAKDIILEKILIGQANNLWRCAPSC